MASGRPDFQGRVITTGEWQRQTKVSVSASASSTSLQGPSKAIEVYNDGPNTVYVNVDAAATTDHRPLRSRTSWSLDVDADSVSLVTASGNSATCYIIEVG